MVRCTDHPDLTIAVDWDVKIITNKPNEKAIHMEHRTELSNFHCLYRVDTDCPALKQTNI